MILRITKSQILAVVFAMVLNTVVVTATFAQGGKGIVTGRVTDSSDSILQAAQIVLQPKGVTAVSDAQGQFFVNDLDPGDYTVTVTYLGFTPFTKTVTVVGGQAVNVDAKLHRPRRASRSSSPRTAQRVKRRESIVSARQTTSCRCSPPM